jgi:nicotinate phosphoribosyltransferase
MKPTNSLVMAALTDLYQISMAYVYRDQGWEDIPAVFELFYRNNPFHGGYGILGGLEEGLRYVENFRFREKDIRFLRDGLVIPKKELIAEFGRELAGGIIKSEGEKYWKVIYGPWGEETCVEVRYPDDDLRIDPPMAGCDPSFFRWLKTLDCSRLVISAIPEGTVVFPRIPLIRVEGPLAVAQLVETALLTLVNYASLMITNASWYRPTAG